MRVAIDIARRVERGVSVERIVFGLAVVALRITQRGWARGVELPGRVVDVQIGILAGQAHMQILARDFRRI
jgi:hypothetical protein